MEASHNTTYVTIEPMNNYIATISSSQQLHLYFIFLYMYLIKCENVCPIALNVKLSFALNDFLAKTVSSGYHLTNTMHCNQLHFSV